MLTGKRYDSKDPDVNKRIILKSIYNKWDVNSWTGLIWYRIEASGAFLRKVINSMLTQYLGNLFNHLTPNVHFSGRTAPLTYRC
jgi:hypothetical protein